MKHAKLFVKGWIAGFCLLVFVGFGYEAWSLLNHIPNDTISHAMTDFASKDPEWPKKFILWVGGLFIALITLVFHWWGNGKFIWKKAVFIDEKEEENKDGK